MCRPVRAMFLAVLVACAHPPQPRIDEPAAVPEDRERHYTIWLGGARVGTAVETEDWSASGVVLRRVETMAFLRGDAEVGLRTEIEIEAASDLVPSRVVWSERGQRERRGAAFRDERGWVIDAEGAPRTLPGDAVPAELVPLVARRDGRFAGRVFLPARGFVSGVGQVAPVAPDRLVARLAFDNGAVAEATIDLDRDGAYGRVVDGDGVIAIRATALEAAAPFERVDLIAATAIPIAGTPSAPDAGSIELRGRSRSARPRSGVGDAERLERRLWLDGDIALPPVPGQAARTQPDGLELVLSPRLPGALPTEPIARDRTAEIRALVAEVRGRIAPDLATGPARAATAPVATAGDCTTYALAYAAHAAARAIPTRVVTGLRIDGDRLIRHRWAVSWTGRSWIAIDAAFGAVPAGGDLIGLAVHDADDAGLVAGEAALTQVRAATWR